MNRSFKVRIYPAQEQQILLEKSFGASRFIYNHFLKLKQYLYQEFNIKITYALQNTLKDLDSAYKKFYNGAGYPKFKRKDDKNSYRTNSNMKINNSFISIPKVGLLRYKDTYKLEEENILKIYNITVSKDNIGHYYASISAEVYIPHFERTNQNVGIDLGLKDFAIFNTGRKINNPRILKNLEKKYRKLAKAVSRKVYDSANYKKAKLKLAKFHKYVTNIRKDFLHKLSTNLLKEFDIICLENLNIKGLMKSNKAKSFQDVAQSEFIAMLKYKAEWYGKTIIQVSQWFPSSQLCSNCGYKNPDLKNLDIREYNCPKCSTHHDRDINAAINILREELRILEENSNI